ncbi:MAG: polyphenol oxidase family protein [Bacteriovoracaceae bacterium]|nr:polyphenol oxidase family protein [Bacteriovoracaceae bacterium]
MHGTQILSCEEGNPYPKEADGLFMSWEKPSCLAIITADCLPLFALGKKGVVALHAGWRGLASGIIQEKKMQECEPEYFYIGPHIRACCYEVSLDFSKNFPQSKAFLTLNDKFYFDLTYEAKNQIHKLFPHAMIEESPLCTYCHSSLHSYRREGKGTRNWNIYRLE